MSIKMKPINATKWFTFHFWANKIKVISFIIAVAAAGWSIQFIWPCSLSEGSKWLIVSICKQTALSHTVGKAANSFSPLSRLSTRHANPTHCWRQKGIYSPLVNILSQWPSPWCLVGLKAMRTGNRRSRLPTTAPPLLQKPWKTVAWWDSRPTMCPRPMFTSSLEALPFPGPLQYLGRKRSQLYEGQQTIVWLWFMWGCMKS